MARPNRIFETQRVTIEQPLAPVLIEDYKAPRPSLDHGEEIQINGFTDGAGNVLERWAFTETDVRWYRLEREVVRRVSVKTRRRVPVGARHA